MNDIFNYFNGLKVDRIPEIINTGSGVLCLNCDKVSRVIVTTKDKKIVKVCEKCLYNYSFDWLRQDLVKDEYIIDYFNSIEKNKINTSIIILMYNALEITKKCLVSLSNIVNKDYELILIDNGSTDGSQQWWEQIKKTVKHNKVKIILNDENTGVARGRNQASIYARGKYLLFLDNDMILLKKIDLNILTNPLNDGYIISDLFKGSVELNGRRHDFALGGFMMTRKDDFKKLGKFDESFGKYWFDDTDFTFKAVKESGKPFKLIENKYVYHIAGISYMSKNKSDIIQSERANNFKILATRWGNSN